MKEQLVNKFIWAFNKGYSGSLPVITFKDVDDLETSEEEIFTPLFPMLAVLHYRQLCDYVSGYAPSWRQIDRRIAIRELLQGKTYNVTYFKLFEGHYWGKWPINSFVPGEWVRDRLEDVSNIKYRLDLLEDKWDKLHEIIHQLHLCVWNFPPSILKDKSEQLIDCLQSYLDEYFAFCSNVGISAPIPLFSYRKIQKEAGQIFLEKVISVIETYRVELLTIGPIVENRAETTFYHRIRALLNCLIALIRCSIIPQPSSSHFFQVSRSKQMISDSMQRFLNTSQTLIGEQKSSLNLSH